MKTTHVLLTGVLCFVIVAFAGAQEAPLLIADAGQAKAVIVAGEGEVAKLAASELEKYLEEIAGADFQVLPAGEAAADGLARIYVGPCDASRAAGLSVEDLARDGFHRAVIGNDLYLLGRDVDGRHYPRPVLVERATLFAVYDLLEDICGVRFFTAGPYGEVVPQMARIEVPRESIVEEPFFVDRSLSQTGLHHYGYPDADAHAALEGEADRQLWLLKARYGTMKMAAGCHSSHYLNWDERFAEEHPDWFALLPNGERATNTPRGSYLCYSHPGVIQTWIDDARAYLTGQPPESRGLTTWNKAGYGDEFMVDPHDSYPYCQCERCQAIFQADPSQAFSDVIFPTVVKVAEAVSDIEGAYVSTLAYGPKRMPPKTVTLPENVRIRLCVNGPLYHSMPGTRDAQMEMIRDWSSRMEGSLVLWLYPNAARPTKPIAGVPEIQPHAIAEFIRAMKPYVKGAYFENESTAHTFRFLDEYVILKLLWDPDQDVDALLNDYYTSFYGPAAEPIGAIYANLEELWRQVYTLYGGDEPRFASRVDLWEKIYTEDALAELDALVEQATALAAGKEAYEWRVGLIRDEMVGRLHENRATYVRELGVAAQTESTCYRAQAQPDADGLLPLEAWEGWPHEVLGPAMETEALHVLTHVKTAWTPEALHLLIECEEPTLENSATKLDREADDPMLWQDNSVEYVLTYNDERIMGDASYHPLVNDRGVISDLNVALGEHDWSWNSEATMKVEPTEAGWRVRIAAPWSTMGIDDPLKLGRAAFNVMRHRAMKEQLPQYFAWSPASQQGSWTEPTRHGQLIFSDEAPPPAPENLLQNGSLDEAREDGRFFATWGSPSSNADNIAQDREVRYDGAMSARLHADEPETVTLLQYVDAVKPGRTYRFTCKIKTDSIEAAEPGHNGAYVVFCAPHFNTFVPDQALIGTSDWRNIEFEATTAEEWPADRRPYVRLRLNGCTGTAWFDEVRLIDVTDE